MSCLAFGPFRLEPSERRLWRAGERVDLEPKAFDVLVALTSRAGHLVTKDALMREVWPEAVVEDNALTVQVSKLRAVLGESARAWTFIETVPRKGYRFAAEVREVPPPDAESLPGAPSRRRWWAAAVGLGVVLALSAATLLASGRAERPPPPRPAASGGADRAAAEEAYARGRATWWTRTDPEGALADFRLATVLDTTFALAHVGEADVHAMGYQTADEARASLDRALAIDPGLGEAYASLGLARMFQEWDWRGADQALGRARALAPDYAPAHQWTATLQMIQGDAAQALAALGRAMALAPPEARPVLHADRCQALYLARRYDAAVEACRRAMELDTFAPFARATGFWSLALSGRADDAVRWWHAVPAAGASPFDGVDPAAFEGPRGRDRLAQHLLARTRSGDPLNDVGWNALVAAFAGEPGRALDLFERAVEVRQFHAPFLAVDPAFDGVRETPRFRAARRQIGL